MTHGHVRLRQRFRDRGAAGRLAARAELAAALPLWALRRTIVGHAVYGATRRQCALLALPHASLRQACGPLHSHRCSALENGTTYRRTRLAAWAIALGSLANSQ